MKIHYYKNPTLSDIFFEAGKIHDVDSFFMFFEKMPTAVDIFFSIGIFGVFYGCWVLLMGILTDNQE